jgi:hypothetical protein
VTEEFKALDVARDEGERWLTEWLAAGFDISAAVLAGISFDRGSFQTFVPVDASVESIKFPDAPDVPGTVSNEGLAWFLDALIRAGARSLVVEDDLAERSDPGQPDESIPSGFIGNRIVHWYGLEVGDGVRAVEMIMKSASHILNAFVSAKSVEELGLLDRQEVSESVGEEIAVSLLAIITFAFDETSFAVWDGR